MRCTDTQITCILTFYRVKNKKKHMIVRDLILTASSLATRLCDSTEYSCLGLYVNRLELVKSLVEYGRIGRI